MSVSSGLQSEWLGERCAGVCVSEGEIRQEILVADMKSGAKWLLCHSPPAGEQWIILFSFLC